MNASANRLLSVNIFNVGERKFLQQLVLVITNLLLWTRYEAFFGNYLSKNVSKLSPVPICLAKAIFIEVGILPPIDFFTEDWTVDNFLALLILAVSPKYVRDGKKYGRRSRPDLNGSETPLDFADFSDIETDYSEQSPVSTLTAGKKKIWIFLYKFSH